MKQAIISIVAIVAIVAAIWFLVAQIGQQTSPGAGGFDDYRDIREFYLEQRPNDTISLSDVTSVVQDYEFATGEDVTKEKLRQWLNEYPDTEFEEIMNQVTPEE